MPIAYKKSEIGEGIYLTEITDEKYKSNYITVTFAVPVDEKTAPLNSLVTDILASSNRKCPSMPQMTRNLAYLYGAVLSARSRRVGDIQENGLSIEYIGDEFTMNKEVISVKAVQTMLDCLFDPQLENGAFSEKYVSMRKKELEDTIRAEINDKFGYSMRRAREIIYKGEPACVNVLGTIENARAVTPQQLYDAYRKLIRSGQINITMCGKDFEAVKPVIIEAMGRLERENVVRVSYQNPSPVKSAPERVSETQDVNQSKMIMAFKSDHKDIYVAKVFAALYGGTPFSKLFSNVREKMSLCYYCSALYADLKGTMIVSSGIARENIEIAEKAILDQLEAVRNGDFTDEELENAVTYLCTGFKSNNDSIYRMAEYYLAQNTRGTAYTPEQVCDIFRSVTRQQVIDCAKTFTYDTFYVMQSQQEVSEDE
ncbi:MAG: insulinase family protein [Ruminococcus sp.]|nr:insulinase family protein [Ruminococcus sp.]